MSVPVLLAGSALVAGVLLPWRAAWTLDLVAILFLGVPHGALDGEIGRTLLRPRLGRIWFTVFALPYLSLAALVLLAWHWSPLATLCVFLAASVWHFGAEDAPDEGLSRKLARGGLPVAGPILGHPAATFSLFGTIAGTAVTAIEAPLRLLALGWLGLLVIDALRSDKPGRFAPLPAMLVLPPLTAFTLYFVCLHAPAHVRALVRHPRRAPRLRSPARAFRLALPVTALTLALGAGLWPLYAGPPLPRLLALTVQGLAAMTLPHMLLDAWLARREGTKQVPATLAGDFGTGYHRLVPIAD